MKISLSHLFRNNVSLLICSILLLFVSLEYSYAQEKLKDKIEFLNFSEGDGDKGLVDMETDQYGNLFAVGFFRDKLSDGQASYTCLADAPGTTDFFAKFNTKGELLWLKQFESPREGNGYIHPEKIELDKYGNIYVFGIVKGKYNMNRSGGYKYLESDPEEDAVEFLAKYNKNGDLIWAQQYEGGFYAGTRDFAVDDNGNSYLLGFRANVAKINSSGQEVYRKYFPGGFTPGAICLYKDKILIGTTINPYSDLTLKFKDGTQRTYPKIEKAEGYFYNSEALVACLSQVDGEMIWADLIRSSKAEEIEAIGVDYQGRVSILGTCSPDALFQYPGQRRVTTVQGSRNSTFLAQYSITGKLNWVKTLQVEDKNDGGGSYGESLEIDKEGGIYLTRAHCSKGYSWAVYFEKYNSSGRRLLYQPFGIFKEDNGNVGFYKSSCGTANFFVHLDNQSNKFYLYGEGKYGLNPSDFGSNRDPKEFKSTTDYFIAKYSLGRITAPSIGNNDIEMTPPSGGSTNAGNSSGNTGESWTSGGNNSGNTTSTSSGLKLHDWTHLSYKSYDYKSFLKEDVINKTIDPYDFDQELFNACIFYLTNKERAAVYKKPFIYLQALEKSSAMHSKDMVTGKFFSHFNKYNARKKDPGKRMAIFGISNGAMAENIAIGSGSKTSSYLYVAQGVVTQWMNSAGHKANIMSNDFKYLGCGVEIDEDLDYSFHEFYSTQNFSSTNF